MSKKENKDVAKGQKIREFIKKYSVIAYVAIGIPLFFLAMLLTAQMKSMSNTEAVLQGKREAQLTDDLVTLQQQYNELKEKYEQSSKVVKEYQTNAASNDELIAAMQEEINNLNNLAGTSNLSGEGIIVTLSDGQTSDSLVHDSDVLTVVNELKAAGAEAICVNNQRIISTSAIRCVGPVIQVNYQKVAAPFEIKAIGNSQYLESALTIKNGVADVLKELGVGISITRQDKVDIPKYEGSLKFKYGVSEK
ncbi:MAG: DUF881 domain-containing protein [Clostridia bacterium]|nr:DUF881 domain-containing protein [Clostridia bacterium]